MASCRGSNTCGKAPSLRGCPPCQPRASAPYSMSPAKGLREQGPVGFHSMNKETKALTGPTDSQGGVRIQAPGLSLPDRPQAKMALGVHCLLPLPCPQPPGRWGSQGGVLGHGTWWKGLAPLRGQLPTPLLVLSLSPRPSPASPPRL